jgi:hypothetical protein
MNVMALSMAIVMSLEAWRMSCMSVAAVTDMVVVSWPDAMGYGNERQITGATMKH